MTLNPLFKLREWLTVDEAAQALSPISERTLMRIVLRLRSGLPTNEFVKWSTQLQRVDWECRIRSFDLIACNQLHRATGNPR